MDDLASFRLLTRSDVFGRWDIASTTYYHFYCKVKVTISAQCFTPPVSKSGRSYNGQLSDKADSVPVVHTRTLLLSPEATWLTKSAFAALKKDTTQPTGASKAYRESQSRIYKLEAPLFVGVVEGTDNLDFLADLSALKVIEPTIWQFSKNSIFQKKGAKIGLCNFQCLSIKFEFFLDC